MPRWVKSLRDITTVFLYFIYRPRPHKKPKLFVKTTRMDVYGEKSFLFLNVISKIVDQGYINFEHIEKFAMIYLSFALLTVW